MSVEAIKAPPAISGPSRSPGRAPTIGAPPGGGFRKASSELSRIPASPRAELSKTIKLQPSLKLENKLTSKPTTENQLKKFQKIEPRKVTELPKAKPSFETVKLIKVEAKPQDLKASTLKGSERFVSKLQPKTEIPRTFQQAFSKSPDSALNPIKAKVPEVFQQAFSDKPEAFLDPTKKAETAKLNHLPKGRDRFQKNSELLAKLNEAKKVKPQNEIKNKLIDAVLKDKNPVEVFAKQEPEKAVSELIAKTPNQSRREYFKKVLADQKVSLPETLLKAEKGSLGSLKTLEQNLQVVKQVLTEKPHASEQKVSPDVLTELTKQSNVIDFQKAKELIEAKKETAENANSKKIETPTQAVKVLEQAKTENKQPEIRPQIEAIIQLLQQPEKINIDPQKRTEAIALLQEVIETKEYAAQPELKAKIKTIVRNEQEKVVEEAEMVKTARYLIEIDAEPEVITQRLQAVTEVKQLPINNEQIEIILEKAEARARYQQFMVESGQSMEEEEDEYQIMMKKLQMLLIELDEKTLENRFKAVFEALEKTWIQALEQGWEKIDGEKIVANLASEEPKEQKSEIVRPLEQTDGSLVEATKDITKMGSFDNLDQARQALSNILINHLPGRATTQPSRQPLTAQQVAEILQGGAYPTKMGSGNQNFSFIPIVKLSPAA